MTSADRKEREKEKRAHDILNKAERLFFSQGYRNVSMDDIAREVELARSTLYLYYTNKEDIYSAIASRGGLILENMFQDCFNTGSSGVERIKLMLLAFIDFSQAYPGYHTAFCLAGEMRTGTPDNGISQSGSPQVITIMMDAVNSGIKDKTLRKNLDPVKTSISLLTAMAGIMMPAAGMAGPLNLYEIPHQEICDYGVSMLIRSIESKQ